MNKQEIDRRVKLLLQEHGLTSHLLCPVCHGGKSQEKTLSALYNDTGLWYQCFRNKCGIRGFLGGSVLIPKTVEASKVVAVPKTLPLPDEHYQHLPVQITSVAPRWYPERQMVMYPVLSYWGRQLGYVQRCYKSLNSWWSGPKALNIITDDTDPFLHFPYLTNEKFCGTLAIVEDWPSAEALSQFVPTCALLGTNLSDTALQLFKSIGVTELVICLDNDALAKAVKLQRHTSLLFDNVRVQFLDKDPKDISQEDLTQIFGGYTCNQ